jgi:hypothetical protein
MGNSSKSGFQGVAGPIYNEQILRFWVFITDPDGTHEEHYDEYNFEFEPQLTLINLNNPSNPLKPISMKWAGMEYDPYPGIDAYFVDVLPSGAYSYTHEEYFSFNFTSGAWAFNISVTDSFGLKTSKRINHGNTPELIWTIGSYRQIWNTIFFGHTMGSVYIDEIIPGAGIFTSLIVSGGYIAAGLLSLGGEKCKAAASIISMGIAGFDIGSTILGTIFGLAREDSGILLGLALGSLVSVIGVSLSTLIGRFNYKKFTLFNPNSLKILTRVSQGLLLVYMILMIYCDFSRALYLFPNANRILNEFSIPTENLDLEMPGEDWIKSVPIPIITYLMSVLSLGAIINIASAKMQTFNLEKNGILGKLIAYCPVRRVLEVYILIKLVIFSVIFTIFSFKSGMHHVYPYLQFKHI